MAELSIGGVSDHGALGGLLDDDHTQYLLDGVGRATPQSLIGGLAAGNTLDLSASSVAGGGLIETNHPIRSLYSEGNTTPAEQTGFGIWEPTFTTAGSYIGQMFRNDATITYTNAFYIYASVLDRSEHISNAAFGFQAFTLFNALPTIRNGTSSDLVQMLVLNDGGVHRRVTAGTSTAIQHNTISSAPHLSASVAGAVMTWTVGAKGLVFAPKFSTVAASTVNMGTLCAVQCVAPAVALFATQAGTENITNINGLEFLAHTNVVSGEIAVIRSAMAPAAGRFFLRNTGGAQSNLGAGHLFNVGIVQNLGDGILFSTSYGAAGGDVLTYWDGTQYVWNPLIGDDMRLAFAANIHTLTSASVSEDAAINFNFPKGAFGEGGAPGNNKYRFVAGAETITIGGDFSQFLLTQSANDTVDAALGTYAGWTINAPSPTIGSGSLVNATALLIGGNPIGAATDRTGLRIISNPTGGAGVNAALYVTAGLSRFDGRVDINNGIALGGGATALLGTIGGAGPTVAAQAQWVEIDVGGVAHWIPAWT